jgi:hypothetical protein
MNDARPASLPWRQRLRTLLGLGRPAPMSIGRFLRSMSGTAAVDLVYHDVAVLERLRLRTAVNGAAATASAAGRSVDLVARMLVYPNHGGLSPDEARTVGLAVSLLVLQMWNDQPEVVAAFLALQSPSTADALLRDTCSSVERALQQRHASQAFLEAMTYLGFCGVQLPGLLQVVKIGEGWQAEGRLVDAMRWQQRFGRVPQPPGALTRLLLRAVRSSDADGLVHRPANNRRAWR